MNEQQYGDMITDLMNQKMVKAGGEALCRATGSEKDWAKIPPTALTAAQARPMAMLQRLAGNAESEKILDRTWMAGERDAAIEFVNYVFDEFALWAITERPDMLKTGRQLINDALPEEEQI